MIQGRTNGELGIKTRSWIEIGSKNRTGVQSSELVLHEVVTDIWHPKGLLRSDGLPRFKFDIYQYALPLALLQT